MDGKPERTFCMMVVLACSVAGLAACGSGDDGPAKGTEKPLPAIDLPAFEGPLAPPKALEVRMGRTEVVVGDPAVTRVRFAGGEFNEFDLRDGRDGLLVIQLYNALKEERKKSKERRLNVLADKETPYRALTQVLYTAGQAEFEEFFLVVGKGDRRTALTILTPSASGTGRTEDDERFDLQVFVTGQGFHFKIAPPFILPWMTGTGGEPDIPSAGDTWDFTALEGRLREIKTAHPKETLIIVGANDDLRFETLIETMLTAMGPPGAPLFPDVMLTRGGII